MLLGVVQDHIRLGASLRGQPCTQQEYVGGHKQCIHEVTEPNNAELLFGFQLKSTGES